MSTAPRLSSNTWLWASALWWFASVSIRRDIRPLVSATTRVVALVFFIEIFVDILGEISRPCCAYLLADLGKPS